MGHGFVRANKKGLDKRGALVFGHGAQTSTLTHKPSRLSAMASIVERDLTEANTLIHSTTGNRGEPIVIDKMTWKSLQLTIGGGSYLIQVSNDETTWFSVGGARTADVLVGTAELLANGMPHVAKFLSVFTTTADAGTAGKLVGHRP